MFLRAEIEVNEKGILAAVERVRKAQTVFNNALYELEWPAELGLPLKAPPPPSCPHGGR